MAKILAYLIGVIALLAAIFLTLILQPKTLSRLVQSQADKYLNCAYQIEHIDLNLFSKFPQLELEIENLNLLHPMQGSFSDTLLGIKRLKTSIHLGKLIGRGDLCIDSLSIEQLRLNAFVDSLGQSNYGIFNLPSNPEDSSSFAWPFRSVQLGLLDLQQADIQYRNGVDSLDARIGGLNLALSLHYRKQAATCLLDLFIPDLNLSHKELAYFNRDSIKIKLPLSLADNQLQVQTAWLVLNHIQVMSIGSVELQEQGMLFDLDFESNRLQISNLLAQIPPDMAALPEGFGIEGNFELQGKLSGLYQDTLMPDLFLYADLDKLCFSYDYPFPRLKQFSSQTELLLDLNHPNNSYILFSDIEASTPKSEFAGKMLVKDLFLDDLLFDLDLNLDLDMQEARSFLPDDMDIHLFGRALGPGKAQFYFSDLMEVNLQQMQIQADVLLQDFDGRYQDYTLATPGGKLHLSIPNDHSPTTLLKADLYQCPTAYAYIDSSLKAEFRQAEVHFELSDAMSTTDSIAFSGKLKATSSEILYNQIAVHLLHPQGEMAMEINFLDSTAVSDLLLDVEAKQFYACMDSLELTAHNPAFKLQMQAQEQDKSSSLLYADYHNSSLDLRYGQDIFISESLGIKAESSEDASQEQALLRWNPKVEVYLHEGDIQLQALSEKIAIPDIQFNYSNDVFNIIDSRIQLGNSDFQFMGKVLNIGDYLADAAKLKAELHFVSNLIDLNQVLKLFDELSAREEELPKAEDLPQTTATRAQQETVEKEDTLSNKAEEARPFMVPKNIDISLNTSIMNAYIGNQIATNLSGRLYVKDDALILEEIGFISSAARLKLTAMYRSPRPNHLYLGLDYHMLDIQIDELLSMFPDLDTIMPMLNSFEGQGEFHLAAETYLDKNYRLKKSTLRAASSIRGDNLVVLDGETFSQISKILMFNKQTKNRIDSLSAEFTVFKNEVDVYPFTLVMDKYKAVVGGRHNLDMSFDYHISLLESPLPMRLGVDISGSLDKLKIRPAACKYAENYRPLSRRVVDAQKLELRKLIRETLTGQVD